uniref:non-specific serine/threonine protein kinase n=1 Tax=Leersia perrieri TaxID=77586 RepID=A0A0D9WTJ0_9ORYZ
MSCQVVVSTILVLVTTASLCGRAAACLEAEREALLSFLADAAPPAGDGIVAEWQGSPDCCTWDGVGCDGGGGGAVTRLWLPGRGLAGTISPSIGNLTELMYLNLSRNSLSGELPEVVFSLSNVTVVDVSYNCLSGELPDELTPLAAIARGGLSLQLLDVSSNLLEGKFPSAIWEHTPRLVSLNASNNSFHGSIPSLCVSCPEIAVLDLSMNLLGGVVSPGFSNCSRLRVLSAGRNNLTGELPHDLFDVKSLQHLLLPSNQIEGRLDPERIAKLTNLVTLDLYYNVLTGELPESIGQLSKLEILRLTHNNLTGPLPPSLSNWTSLRCLDLRSNTFVGDLTDIDFSGLGNLTVFDIDSNNFTGTMPLSIYSCTSMKALRISHNRIGGQVSPEIGKLKELQFLSLTLNSFVNISGMFWNLKGCTSLTALLLSYNFYGEALPDAGWVSDHIRNVRVIVMQNCMLTGVIPSWLSNLQGLNVLNLSGNRLTGPIPSWLGAMSKLYYVDLSGNLLSGQIPLSLKEMQLLTSEQAMSEFNPGYLPLMFTVKPDSRPADQQGRGYYQLLGVATTLNFSDNNITGMIPPEIGKLKTLQVLDVGSNKLTGGIPPELSSLARLQILDLRWNRLTGMIPSVLNELNFLAVFNVSYNDLEGPIPTGGQFDAFPPKSFKGNPKLCGQVISVPCSNKFQDRDGSSSKLMGKKVLIAIVLGVSFGLVALIVFLGCVVIVVRREISNGVVRDGGKSVETSLFDSMSELHSDTSKDMIFFMSDFAGKASRATKTVTFMDVLKATNNFSPANIIGSGGFGLVFRAEMEDGTKLAVKRLNGDMCLVEREFQAEVDALSATRHDNLVPLLGYCIRGRLRLLIYPYMANGSLHDWLHERRAASVGDDAPKQLDWRARLNIARGASRGVLYIHEKCKPQIVHRDIKSSNILLDEAGEARVADFGLARLILPDRTHVTTELVGTLGYIPPEYGQAWAATLRGDVYSFGVVLLELLTGRQPVETLPPPNGQQWVLARWVEEMRSQGRHAEVLDPRLRGNGDEAQMLNVLDLACLCVHSAPFSRPAIVDVVCWLDNLQQQIRQAFPKEQSSLLDFLAQLSPGHNGGLNMLWVRGTDCYSWEGIDCRDQNTLRDISLPSKGLAGSISPSLSNLTRLLHLNLSHNSLSGGLPMDLMFLSSIAVLDVSFNHLDGSLQELQSSNPGLDLPLQVSMRFSSATWEVMKNLVALNASNNSFTGQIPASICINAPSFAVLDLSYNQFSGNVSPKIGKCSMLRVLKAGYNNLTGAIPNELFSFRALEHLSLPYNGLQGILNGSHIVKLANLTVLDLGSTGLSGNIPDSIGQLRRLQELHLDNNNMFGELPSALGNCTNLIFINLRGH